MDIEQEKSLPPTPNQHSRPPPLSSEPFLKPTEPHEHMAEVPTTTDDPPALGRGDVERPNDPETKDLGWSEDPRVPVPVVQGLDNEHLWLLVRRFNKQVYRLKAIPDSPPGVLDLKVGANEEFSPDKLRSTLERLYTTIIVGLAGTFKHLARIRSWTEIRRSAAFCSAYFIAWFFNLLLPLVIGTFLLLILYPPSRPILFPPAPLAAIDAVTGKVKTPAAGHLGSHDSMSGSAEHYKGEAVEKEANHFVSGLSNIAVSVAVGKEANAEEGDDSTEGKAKVDKVIPNVADVTRLTEVQSLATGDNNPEDDLTKKPVQDSMWEKTRPIMQILTTTIDIWEMTANALTTTPPFKSLPMRLRLASPFVPIFIVSLLVPEFVVYKTVTFGIGFGIFGQPVIDRVPIIPIKQFLDRHVPNWPQLLDIRNSLLAGVPTNAQLTLTLLRLGEKNKSPLPPPPPTSATSEETAKGSGSASEPIPPPTAHPDDLPPEYSEQAEKIHAERALSHSPTSPSMLSDSEDGAHDDNLGNKAKRKGSKLIGLVKGTTKAAVNSVLQAEKVRATAGSEHAKEKTGIVKPVEVVEKIKREDGPSTFQAKWKGKIGSLTLSVTGTVPLIAFTRETKTPGKEPETIWSVAIDDIVEVKKIGGFGWKGKAVVGWSMGAQVIDGRKYFY